MTDLEERTKRIWRSAAALVMLKQQSMDENEEATSEEFLELVETELTKVEARELVGMLATFAAGACSLGGDLAKKDRYFITRALVDRQGS